MAGDSPKSVRIADPEHNRPVDVGKLIVKLGIREVAKRYRVRESTVRKWLKGIHHPSRKTISRSWKELF